MIPANPKSQIMFNRCYCWFLTTLGQIKCLIKTHWRLFKSSVSSYPSSHVSATSVPKGKPPSWSWPLLYFTILDFDGGTALQVKAIPRNINEINYTNHSTTNRYMKLQVYFLRFLSQFRVSLQSNFHCTLLSICGSCTAWNPNIYLEYMLTISRLLIAVAYKFINLHPIKELIFHLCSNLKIASTFTPWSWGPLWIISLGISTSRCQCIVFNGIVIEEVTILAAEVGQGSNCWVYIVHFRIFFNASWFRTSKT